MRKVIQSPVICLLPCHCPVGSVFNGLVSFVIFLCTPDSLMFCTRRPRPSDVNLKISSHLLSSQFSILRPFSYACYWITVLKLFFPLQTVPSSIMSIDLYPVLHKSSHYFFLFFLYWNIYETLYIVISCYRKTEECTVDPSYVQINTKYSETIYRHWKLLLYKSFIIYLFMQQTVEVAEKLMGILHNQRGG